jgi:hypothetical protein
LVDFSTLETSFLLFFLFFHFSPFWFISPCIFIFLLPSPLLLSLAGPSLIPCLIFNSIFLLELAALLGQRQQWTVQQGKRRRRWWRSYDVEEIDGGVPIEWNDVTGWACDWRRDIDGEMRVWADGGR